MFPIKKDNCEHMQTHNIRISELNSSPDDIDMSQPRKVIHLPKIRMLSHGAKSSSIRITNVVKPIKPDPELAKKQEEERLRAQLQKEIVSRSRICAHRTYECVLPVVTGRLYCARHILNDATAPYKQCEHLTSSGARCSEPAPADKDPGLCFEHARAALHSRQRSAAPPPPVTTTETLLNQLQHYVRPERTRTTSCASSVSVVSDPADQEQIATHAVDPFKEIDATSVNTTVSASIMECASASDSESDSVILGSTGDCRWHDHDDTEDPPCESQPLWHAGVYTAEEAVSEAKNVLKSLQSAYIRQMGRLRVLLQTARLQYVRSLRAEKEQYCSINSQARSGPLTVRERRQLRKLRAYAGYHRKHGVDAVLARKLHHKRAKINDISNRHIPSQGRCTFVEGGVRCPTHTVPATKHCMKHILQDRHQVLFAACGDLRGSVACREPIAKLPLPSATCRYHTGPPAYTTFTLKKEDTGSDSESHSSSDLSHTEAQSPEAEMDSLAEPPDQ
ncbi:KAT8 regulatory NSL complex subunit 2 isoform X2 [Maniola jurtina]|uniref:KAT8 regulatory NSL complex subunit 2 isoform X1 n=2 Tax=Maniola jurtina TaxID=191418 RepID=UPI001E688B7B|nr:KAT8 regulatory NSL complex subunit 2 isoform X1 [Maniola jurtina]XP_045782396.1 KAT8 regulatory NSL complex subunit 2 isoform X2 [Maniola jurtina]